MTVRSGVNVDQEDNRRNAAKRQNYSADILYTTHAALGFDYLLNNLVSSAEDRFLREFYYVIIDEADMVLMDAATMPLVISGAPHVQSNLYEMMDFFVTTLQPERDFFVSSAWCMPPLSFMPERIRPVPLSSSDTSPFSVTT